MRGMKTLVISGAGAPLPAPLRAVIARGSTSVDERRAADIDPASPVPLAAVDRVVFWSAASDAAVRALAARFARAEAPQRREAIVFVTADGSEQIDGLSQSEVYVWPADEDRLMMAFMTGA